MNMFRMELRNLRKSTIRWTCSVGCIILLMLAFYPSMQTEAMQAITNAKLDSIDPAVLAAMGLQEIPDFTVISNFFGYVLQFITLALMVFVTQQASSLLIKEESEGTIEFLYAKPVSRFDIILQKAAAHVLLWVMMILALLVVTLTGYLMFGNLTFLDSLKECLLFYGSILLIGLLFSAIGLLVSTLMKSVRSSSGVTIGLVFGTFVVGATSAVVKELEFLRYFSPMDWIKASKLMRVGLHPEEWAIAAAIIIICPVLAWLKYRKKDFLI